MTSTEPLQSPLSAAHGHFTRHRFVALLLGTLVLMVVGLLVFVPDGNARSQLVVGQPLPPLVATTLPTDSSPSYRVVVVASPTCGHCHTLLSELGEMWSTYLDPAVDLVVVYLGHAPGATPGDFTAPTLSTEAYVLIDSVGSYQRALDLQFTPLTIVLDPVGLVDTSLVGAAGPEQLRELLVHVAARAARHQNAK